MHQKSVSKLPVVFVTPTKFGVVNNGPAIYANYLWDSFVQHPEIDFHLVTPESDQEHDQIHVSGCFKSSRKQYEAMQRLAIEVANSIGTHQSAIVHGNTAHTMWLFANYRGPVIAQVNDYDAADAFDNPIRTLLDYGPRRLASLAWRRFHERKATRFLSRIICNSQYTRQRVLKQYQVEPTEKAHVIYKAVDLEPFKKARSKREKFDQQLIGQRQILFVGCNWHRKGLDCLIEAVSLLDEKFNDVSLIVAGAQSQKADKRIRRLPELLGISDRVQFLGRVNRENLIQLYGNVKLAALPSRQEALGVAILESLAAGLPVVATRVGGISEILEGCASSSLVDPEDSRQLADAIQNILSKDESDTGRVSADVARRFKKELMISSLESLYFELVSDGLSEP